MEETMGYRLDAQDEYPHPPSAEPHFNESVYCNGFDRRTGAGGWMRLGNRVNEGYAELSVCLYLPDGPNLLVNADQWFEQARCVRGAVRLEQASASPAHGGVPDSPDHEPMYG